jgi:hypothetical protein
MRSKLLSAALLAVVLAIAGGTLASAHGGSDRHRARVVTLFAVTDQEQFVDLGKTGPSLGDMDVFSDNVFDHEGGTQLGTDGGVCTIVRLDSTTSATAECVVTVSVTAGQISVQGLVTFDPSADTNAPATFDLPVTGGTGDFENAGGHVTVHEVGDKTDLTFYLE